MTKSGKGFQQVSTPKDSFSLIRFFFFVIFRSVLLYPSGNNEKDSISLYLESVDCKNDGEDICAQVILCVVDPTDPTRFISQGKQNTKLIAISSILKINSDST